MLKHERHGYKYIPHLSGNSKIHVMGLTYDIIYRYLLELIWTYSVIYGIAKKTHLQYKKTFQFKLSRLVSKSPLYVTNKTLHADL